ncbi:MAG: nucleotidyltransferase family protein [Gemmatimonadaceae bacterium]
MSKRPDQRIGTIILAAGSSTRLGKPKQLIELYGQPLVRRAVFAAKNAGSDEIIVVVGALAEKVTAAVSNLTNVATALNPDWKAGLASSLVAGLNAAMKLRLEGVLVMTTDQPLIDSASLRKLLDAFESGHRIVAAAYDDIAGVPAVFGAEHFDDLMRLKGDEGAGSWLRSRPGDVTTISIGNAAIDIDTPADIATLHSHMSGRKE